MHDDAPLALLDDVGKYRQAGRLAGISTRKHINVAAFSPGDIGRGMDSLLHILAIKVQRRKLGLRE